MRRMLLAVMGLGLGAGLLGIFFGTLAWQSLEPLPEASAPGCYPLQVEGTQLRVLLQAEYRGPLDTARYLSGTAAALVVENTGPETISQGAVVLEQQGRTLVFELRDLPPGEQQLLLEKDAQPYIAGVPTRCYGWTQPNAERARPGQRQGTSEN